jgi:predicted enzyme related to lactoylglutathione lyase
MLRLADLAVTVSDAKASAQWWIDKVGFETHTIGAPGGHALMVAPPGDRFLLHLCEGMGAVEPGNTGIAFMTDEIETVVQKMQSAGVHFPEPLKQEAWGGSAKFADPDGNIFWLLGAPTAFVQQEGARRASERPVPDRQDIAEGRNP